jgi:hypothetical protein
VTIRIGRPVSSYAGTPGQASGRPAQPALRRPGDGQRVQPVVAGRQLTEVAEPPGQQATRAARPAAVFFDGSARTAERGEG